ncbi:PEGA domain-containing protein [Methanoplanus sp. FWC-SCC4]|uniref:PEGA domain-containing protein n=1 Tax=Methanochimaera problematica TaxID=2609417 RepID=A0AA97FGQ3_9EURY|nr:PEGA domain-containing protein [Methanoplanus sp. FWC-SCC4]WOF17121.1 PEGA domain-containing protein [Methanoplanus sp. FWC-SCC4]
MYVKKLQLALILVYFILLLSSPVLAEDNATVLPVTGYITITSDPSAANVAIDGRDIGNTPITGYEIESGTHEITVSKTGYESKTESVTLSPGEQSGISVTLEPVKTPTETETPTPTMTQTPVPTTAPPTVTPTPEPGIGWYVVHCNLDNANVYFDGLLKGTTKNGQLTVEYTVGSTPYNKVTVSKSGYISVSQNLPLPPSAGQTVNTYLTLQPEPSTNGQLTVYSNPSGASVYVDRNFKGSTPLTASLKPGSHALQIAKSGYREINENIFISTGQTLTREYTLQTETEYGTLSVSSDPAGAGVYIDEIYRGLSTVTVKNLVVGNHDIKVTASGYSEWKGTQFVKKNAVMTVHARLVPVAGSNKGYVRVTSEPGEAEVYLDGRYMGLTGEQGTQGSYALTLNPGTYTISVEKTGYRDYEVQTSVSSGQTAWVHAVLVPFTEPLTGSVSVTSDPEGAGVYIDDVYKGITPVQISGVTAGEHQVMLKLDGYGDSHGKVTVSAGGTSTVSVAMKPYTEPTAAPGFGINIIVLGIFVVILYCSRKRG